MYGVKVLNTYDEYFINPCPAEPGYTLPFQNSVDPDQLASKKVNLYQQSGSNNMIGWKFEKGVAS